MGGASWSLFKTPVIHKFELLRRISPSPAGRSPQRAGSHAKCGRILRGARGRAGEGVSDIANELKILFFNGFAAPTLTLPHRGRGHIDGLSRFVHYIEKCFSDFEQALRTCLESAGKAKFPLPRRAKPAAGGFPRKMRAHFAWGPGEGRGGGSDIIDKPKFCFFNYLLPSPLPSLAARAVPVPQGEGVYRRFYLLPFTQENRFSQTINRLSKKRIQHVVEQGEAAFGRFQSLLNGGLKQSLRDEAVERRA